MSAMTILLSLALQTATAEPTTPLTLERVLALADERSADIVTARQRASLGDADVATAKAMFATSPLLSGGFGPRFTTEGARSSARGDAQRPGGARPVRGGVGRARA